MGVIVDTNTVHTSTKQGADSLNQCQECVIPDCDCPQDGDCPDN
jgi:hypothetical protein